MMEVLRAVITMHSYSIDSRGSGESTMTSEYQRSLKRKYSHSLMEAMVMLLATGWCM
jgi:hypothetical protein